MIQEIYRRYGKHGAAITANVISYGGRGAAGEIGKALNFSPSIIDRFSHLFASGDFPHTLELESQNRTSSGFREEPSTHAGFHQTVSTQFMDCRGISGSIPGGSGSLSRERAAVPLCRWRTPSQCQGVCVRCPNRTRTEYEYRHREGGLVRPRRGRLRHGPAPAASTRRASPPSGRRSCPARWRNATASPAGDQTGEKECPSSVTRRTSLPDASRIATSVPKARSSSPRSSCPSGE